MKKKIFLILLFAVIISVAFFVLYEKDNIVAFNMAMDMTEEQIAKKTEENNEEIKKITKELADIDIESFGEELNELLLTGKLTKEEVIDKIVGSSGIKNEKNDNSARIIAQIYVLRSEAVGKLQALVAEAKKEYIGLPAQQKGLEAKLDLAKKYVKTASGLEGQYDKEAEALFSQLETELLKNNKSTEIIDEMRKAYTEQKKLYKAELISKYYPK